MREPGERCRQSNDVLVSGLSLWTPGLDFGSWNCLSRGWDACPTVSVTHHWNVASRTIIVATLPGYAAWVRQGLLKVVKARGRVEKAAGNESEMGSCPRSLSSGTTIYRGAGQLKSGQARGV